MAKPLGVNIISTFDNKGIQKAIRDFSALKTGSEKAAYGLRTLDKGMTTAFTNIVKFGAKAGAVVGVVGFGLVKMAENANTSNARIAQINKSMGLFGEQTQVVTDRLIKLGETQAMATGIDRNAIKETIAKLLTFKELAATADVVGGAFDRATQAALDLAASGFGEATQNATQLGKALNDPIKGITALARSGVTFTEQEKAKIKTLVESGKMLEAQDTLLKAIETQVGGTAKATANASEIMKQGLGMAAESLGQVLLPYFEKLVNWIVQKVVPAVQHFSSILGSEGLGAALGLLAGGFMNAISRAGAFGNTMLALIAVMTTIRVATIAYNATIATMNVLNAAAKAGFLGTAVGVRVLDLALKSTQIGLIVAGIAALIAIIAFLIIKFKVLRDAIATVGGWIKSAFGWLGGLRSKHEEAGKAAGWQAGQVDKVTRAYTVAGGTAATTNDKMHKFFRDSETGATALRMEVLKGANSFDDFSSSAGGAGKTVETAKEKLQKYIDALKGMNSAQKSARDADKSLMKSRTSLAEATTKLTDAQAYFNQVVAGYGANSQQAKDRQLALEKAQRAVERAGYDVEEAVFAVSDAEDELAKLRTDPESSAQAIREAEIKLAEAKLNVKDATDAQAEATDALAEAEQLLDEAINGAKEGSDAYTDALNKLNDAKQAQLDATDAVTEALERQAEAVERLIEAEEKARQARVGGAGGAAAEAKYGSPFSAVATGAGGVGSGVAEMAAVAKGILTQGQANELMSRRGLVPFATGGIVTQPTRALIGEAGAEAVIPLDRLQSGMTVNVTVNAGIGVNPAQVGNEIVDILQRYQRKNGSVPIKVA